MESVFQRIRKDISKEIEKTENFTELKEKLNEVLGEWDLSEENQYYT